jgi:hypothetical protein
MCGPVENCKNCQFKFQYISTEIEKKTQPQHSRGVTCHLCAIFSHDPEFYNTDNGDLFKVRVWFKWYDNSIDKN